MTVIIDKFRFLFSSAPKVACTSIKHALFEVENGFPFTPFHANGIFRHIHDPSIYPAVHFQKINQERVSDYRRITMVRDPVSRFISAYSNRVVYYSELSEGHIGEKAQKMGLSLTFNPSLSEFIRRIDDYRAVSPSIRLHTDPLVDFIGNDSSYYGRVFNIKQMDEFNAYVSDVVGSEFNTPHLQTGGPKIPRSELTGAEVKILMERYAHDYAQYGQFF